MKNRSGSWFGSALIGLFVLLGSLLNGPADFGLMSLNGIAFGQEPDAPATEQDAKKDRTKKKKGLKTYMGRRIAEPMSFHGGGAQWLFRSERTTEEDPERMLVELGLKPGMAVCDMGCGNGYYSLPMANLVTGTGKVYAVDIQIEMLQELKARAEQAGIQNVEPIQGDLDDPKLPAGELDIVLMVDVYHEFSHPEEMLAAIRKALKPTGLVALVEFRGEDPRVPIKPLHKMTKEQILKEYTANGFKLVKEFDGLPIQHLMFLGPNEESP